MKAESGTRDCASVKAQAFEKNLLLRCISLVVMSKFCGGRFHVGEEAGFSCPARSISALTI